MVMLILVIFIIVNFIIVMCYSCYFYFYFYVRAEGEATITISIRHCCRNWWGRVKNDFRNPVVFPTTRCNKILPKRWAT